MLDIKKLSSKDFPEKLKQLHAPPKRVYVSGNLSALEQPCVAIVGSRQVSPYGRQVTERLASDLASDGITIISGLALGVDSIAHRACLEAGGKTIAVLPTAITNIHPTSHRGLAKEIVEAGGALVSEYDDNDPITRVNFVARNRIVAALADVVVITEAALKSGSLHTARYALELGRDVMAVPGNITSKTSEGANNLLKSGAAPITSAGDVLFSLGIDGLANQSAAKITGANESEQTILDLIFGGISAGNELLAESGLDTSSFSQALTALEISGKIRPLGANQWGLA